MKYVVTDDFVAAHGWTPDKTAKALMEPLARIGVLVERTRGFGLGGFQSLLPSGHVDIGNNRSRVSVPVLLEWNQDREYCTAHEEWR